MIPRFGYRFDDMRDEGWPMPERAKLAEFAALAREASTARDDSTAREPSAQVRERRGVYGVRCSA